MELDLDLLCDGGNWSAARSVPLTVSKEHVRFTFMQCEKTCMQAQTHWIGKDFVLHRPSREW